jgi:hypothetical protein
MSFKIFIFSSIPFIFTYENVLYITGIGLYIPTGGFICGFLTGDGSLCFLIQNLKL